MIPLLLRSLSIFITALEVLLLLYIFFSMLPVGRLSKVIYIFVEPILMPIQYLFHRSVLDTPVIDLSPIVAVLILSYIGQFIST